VRGILIGGLATSTLVVVAVWTRGAAAPPTSSHAAEAVSMRGEVARAPSSRRSDPPGGHRPRSLAPGAVAVEPTLQELWARRAQEPAVPAAAAPSERDEADELAADAHALAGFTDAFENDGRDPAWSDEMEGSIAEALATTPDAPRLVAVECRATLCRIELHGTMDTLPFSEPFTSTNAWWVDGADGAATLMLSRDIFADPFTS
jgi:hypothetical protein